MHDNLAVTSYFLWVSKVMAMETLEVYILKVFEMLKTWLCVNFL